MNQNLIAVTSYGKNNCSVFILFVKDRTHPSVVDKFQTSPLKGFIIDLSLWKDRIFEVWVCSLGFAKFGFFIPFVHMVRVSFVYF